jgi:hypothetical protein
MKAALLLATVVAFVFPSALFAQTEIWQVDRDRSTALISLVPSNHPSEGLNYGVEMVGGTMFLDDSDFSKLSLTLNIFPAGQSDALLYPDGAWRVGGYAQLSRYTVFNFTSKAATRTADGRLRLAGDLTITHVVRTAPSDGNVSYSGPATISPEEKSVTREVIFLLDKSAADIESARKVGWLEIKGLGTLVLEGAPGLWDWLADSVWPRVVFDRRCWTPGVNLRDYHGVVCAGTVVAAENKAKELPRSNSTVDYAGERYRTPEGLNQLRLTLDLRAREAK